MINQIFQNSTGSRKYAHSGNENIGYLSAGSANGAIDGFFHRLRAWLAGIDRQRAIEYENAKAIAHLQSLTDGKLRDIGIERPDIERAVRLGRDSI